MNDDDLIEFDVAIVLLGQLQLDFAASAAQNWKKI